MGSDGIGSDEKGEDGQRLLSRVGARARSVTLQRDYRVKVACGVHPQTVSNLQVNALLSLLQLDNQVERRWVICTSSCAL